MPDPTLIVAGIAAGFALLFWVGYVRTVPSETAAGTVIAKTHQPASTYTQSHGTHVATRIPVAESYLLTIRIDGIDPPARLSVRAIASADFEVGQRVLVQYERRGVFPFPRQLRLMDVQRIR